MFNCSVNEVLKSCPCPSEVHGCIGSGHSWRVRSHRCVMPDQEGFSLVRPPHMQSQKVAAHSMVKRVFLFISHINIKRVPCRSSRREFGSYFTLMSAFIYAKSLNGALRISYPQACWSGVIQYSHAASRPLHTQKE